MKENLIFAHSISLLDFCGSDENAFWNIGKCKNNQISSKISFVDKDKEVRERVFLTTVGTMGEGFNTGMIYY